MMLTKPTQYQSDIIKTLDKVSYYGLFWEMGLGKTWAGCYLIDKYIGLGKILVISPNSVRQVWVDELAKHTDIPSKRICLLEGTSNQRRELLQSKASVFVINYEGLRWIEKELRAISWEMVIVDESQRIKNVKAVQTRIAVGLKRNRAFILSGTPVLKDYQDVFSQFLFMDKGKTFGENFYSFRNFYFQDLNAGRYRGNFPDWAIKKHLENTILEKMKYSSSRLEKKDCLKHLPKKIYETKYCYLSEEQEKAYKEIKQECITYMQEQACLANTALTKIIRLNQITSGFLKTSTGELLQFANNPKLELLKETVEEILQRDNKVIIWAHFVHDILAIQKLIGSMGIECVSCYGETKDRGVIVDKFQKEPGCKVFIGQPHSAGLGLTLTSANYAIYYSYNFSLEDRLQSEDRCHRKGSEIHNSITYIDLVADGTIDKFILKNLKSKNCTAEKIMNYIKGGD